MNKLNLSLVCFLLLTQVSCALNPKDGPLVTLKGTVLNEQSEPIADALIEGGFQGLVTEGSVEKAFTDEDGYAEVTGRTSLSAFFRASKEGFYTSIFKRVETSEDTLLGEFIPRTREREFTLRQILNPRPLMAKRVHELSIPLENEWIGYDLELGDWVEPQGKGQRADFLLRYKKEFLGLRISEENLKRARELNSTGPIPWTEEREKETYGRWTADFEIRFPGEDEGILPVTGAEGYIGASDLRLPHQAPEEGYQRSIEWKEVTNFSKGEIITNTIGGYFLRTRVVKRGGKIVEAHYAKISLQDNNTYETKDRIKPPIQLSARGKISFSYYFNPDVNDRNLEFDPGQNLLEVDWDGRVQLP